jgi:hypothetical protein|nr:Tn3 family transposase [Streptomyces sp. OV198]
MVLGLFRILGYNFSPLFCDLDDQRFWRATMPGAEAGMYGVVEDPARNEVSLHKVITHWPNTAGGQIPGRRPGARLRPAADADARA